MSVRVVVHRSALTPRLASCLVACLVTAHAAVAQGDARAPVASTADVGDFELSPDGARVVYLASPDNNGAFELFSVPIAGGPARRLNQRPVAGGNVTAFAISPDARRVAFLGDLDTDETFELYSAPIRGRPPVKLSPVLVPRGDVLDFALSSDSRRVVFRANAEHAHMLELFSAPLSGGPAVKLNAPLAASSEVFAFRISADGTRVVYKAYVESQYGFGLYSVPIGGGPTVELSLPVANDGDGSVQAFELASSGKFVVFVANRAGQMHLFAAPIVGGGPLELGGAGFDFNFIASLRIDPDGQRVLFLGEHPFGPGELFSVSIRGGPPTVLNAPLPAEQTVHDFELSPDGSRAVYYLENGDAHVAVFSASVKKAGVVELARPADSRFRISPDSRRVLCVHDEPTFSGLWSFPIEGGPGAPLAHADFDSASISPDSRRLVYTGCVPGEFVTQLYSIPLAGGASVRLNPPLVAGGSVLNARISADSTRVVYRADQDTRNRFELYSVPIDGGTPVQLNSEFE